MPKRFEQNAGPSQRQQRVAELVRHALAEVLARGDIQDEVITRHVITIPEVRMSPDLKLATAYVMPLGGRDESAVIAALDRHRKLLRQEVARAGEPQIRARTCASAATRVSTRPRASMRSCAATRSVRIRRRRRTQPPKPTTNRPAP
jgi:ribosome-binding factor A